MELSSFHYKQKHLRAETTATCSNESKIELA